MKGAGAARVDEEKVCWRRYTSGNSLLSGASLFKLYLHRKFGKDGVFLGRKNIQMLT